MNREFLNDFFHQVKQKHENAVKNLENYSPDIAKLLKLSKYSVFYTNPLNTLKEGDIYFLGLNPGGTPEDEKEFDVENLTFFDRKPNWSDFTCEKWKHKNREFPEGEAPLQKRIRQVLTFISEAMGNPADICEIFCSNLYFFRSPDTKTLISYGIDNDKNYNCWQYHEQFLRIVKPRIIICNGNGEGFSPFAKIYEKLKDLSIGGIYKQHCYGTFWLKFFFSKTFWGREKVLVLGIPHLSRFKPSEGFLNSVRKLIE